MTFANLQRACLGQEKRRLPWQQCIWEVCHTNSFEATRKAWAGHDEWQGNELQSCPLGDVIHHTLNALMAFCNEDVKVDKTLDLCESVLEEDPTNLMALALQCMSYAKHHDYVYAQTGLDRLKAVQNGREEASAQLRADLTVVYCWRALGTDHCLTAVKLIEEIWEKDGYKREALNTSEDGRRIQQFLNFHYGLMVYRTLHNTEQMFVKSNSKRKLDQDARRRISKAEVCLKRFDDQPECQIYSARAAITLCELNQAAMSARFLNKEEVRYYLEKSEVLAGRHTDGITLSRVAKLWRTQKQYSRMNECLEVASALTEKPPFSVYHQIYLCKYDEWITNFLKTHPMENIAEEERLGMKGHGLWLHLTKERYTPKDVPNNLKQLQLLDLVEMMKERFRTNSLCLAIQGQMEYAQGSSLRKAVDFFKNALKYCSTSKDEAIIHSTWAACCRSEALLERNPSEHNRHMTMYKNHLWDAMNCNAQFFGCTQTQQALSRELPTTRSSENPEEWAHILVMRARLLISIGAESRLIPALECLTEVLRLSPGNASALKWMGVCYEEWGDLQNACDVYRELLRERAAIMTSDKFPSSSTSAGVENSGDRREIVSVLNSLFYVTERIAQRSLTSGDVSSAAGEYAEYILVVLSLIKGVQVVGKKDSLSNPVQVPVAARDNSRDVCKLRYCCMNPDTDHGMAIERFFETEAGLTVENIWSSGTKVPGHRIKNLAGILLTTDLFIISIAEGASGDVLSHLDHVLMEPTLTHEENINKFVVVGEKAAIYDLNVSDVLKRFFFTHWVGEYLEMKAFLRSLTEKAEGALRGEQTKH